MGVAQPSLPGQVPSLLPPAPDPTGVVQPSLPGQVPSLLPPAPDPTAVIQPPLPGMVLSFPSTPAAGDLNQGADPALPPLPTQPQAQVAAPPPPSPPVQPDPPPPPPDPNAPPPKRFNIVTYEEGASAFLPRLAKLAGVTVKCVGDMFAPIDRTFKNATFEEVLATICGYFGIESHRQADGSYKVGYPSDLRLEANDPNDTTPIEYIYRPRHLDAESLAQSLSAAFPEVRCLPGPLHLSPSLDDGSPSSGASPMGMPMGMAMGMPGGMPGYSASGGSLSSDTIGGIKALSSSSTPFKRHAVTLQGPVNRVKHALIMARRLDRGRRQVRINVSMTEMTTNDAKNLGINWDFSGSNLTVAEVPNPQLGVVSGTSGGNAGLRFGTFAHTPASVNLQLQAGIAKGTIKTLADPSLLVIDGERCFLLLGEKYLYPQQIGVNAQGNPTYNVAQLATGVYLQMAVQIGLDDDVIITVYPQNSYVSGTQTYSNTAYPIIVTREAQTTVRLRSHELLAIGGLHQGSDNNQVSKLPFLGDLPFFKYLFGSQSKMKNSDELVIIIQPEILPAESTRTSIIEEIN